MHIYTNGLLKMVWLRYSVTSTATCVHPKKAKRYSNQGIGIQILTRGLKFLLFSDYEQMCYSPLGTGCHLTDKCSYWRREGHPVTKTHQLQHSLLIARQCMPSVHGPWTPGQRNR
jgi:hypothetical protein